MLSCGQFILSRGAADRKAEVNWRRQLMAGTIELQADMTYNEMGRLVNQKGIYVLTFAHSHGITYDRMVHCVEMKLDQHAICATSMTQPIYTCQMQV